MPGYDYEGQLAAVNEAAESLKSQLNDRIVNHMPAGCGCGRMYFPTSFAVAVMPRTSAEGSFGRPENWCVKMATVNGDDAKHKKNGSYATRLDDFIEAGELNAMFSAAFKGIDVERFEREYSQRNPFPHP